MDFFFTIGLLLLAFPVIAIVALVKTININDRLRGMEARLAALEPKTAGAPGAAPAPIVTPQPVPPPPAPQHSPPPVARAAEAAMRQAPAGEVALRPRLERPALAWARGQAARELVVA